MSDEATNEAQVARPPRDNLYRAISSGLELRSNGDGDGEGSPTMVGHFAVFDQWTEIDSVFEGRFLERFVPGAFSKTIREGRDRMRVLFQHGFDPQVGDKPLGPIAELREDEVGAWYEVPLLDAGYVRDEVLPGLEADLYGASFRFRVLREEIDDEPGSSDHNPDGIQERTVKEAEVREFGPVTFPAYQGASAGVRSLTDEFAFGRLTRDPERMRQIIDFVERAQTPIRERDDEGRRKVADQDLDRQTPTDGAGSDSHPDHGTSPIPMYGLDEARKEKPSWLL